MKHATVLAISCSSKGHMPNVSKDKVVEEGNIFYM